MSTAIKCNVIDCKYNGGTFCKKSIIFIYGGICGELVDKNGNRKDPKQWMKTNWPDDKDYQEEN